VDIANDLGTPILAADGGVVFFAEDDGGGYGLLVKIQHDNGGVTYYAHCSKLYVQEGDVVSQGDVIAEIGSTGQASGNHCHFELHPGGGEAADPMKYLPACPYPRLP
jgi:murein DD-endopeptidase MepM/ murein hydrolase activator NlpD